MITHSGCSIFVTLLLLIQHNKNSTENESIPYEYKIAHEREKSIQGSTDEEIEIQY